MLPHGDRHLPCVQRPHTRGHSHTRSVTHTPCLTHTHTTHTRGGTHPRCFTHAWGFAHTCRLWRARGFFPLRCSFHTRRAGKHARRHTRDHTTRTRGLTCTRGLIHARGLIHTGVSLAHEDAFTHALLLPACVRRSTRFNTVVYTHRDTTHPGTTLATTHTGTLTLGILASTRAPGVFTPPKLRVHPSAALTSSTSRGTTESTWP